MSKKKFLCYCSIAPLFQVQPTLQSMDDLSWPEPGPNWPEAKNTWGLAWEIHVYTLGGSWALAGLYYLLFFVQAIFRISSGRKKRPFIMLSFQLLIHALCRCLVLFINPYGSNSSSQVTMVVSIVTWSFGTAGLTSAFGVLLLILLDTTKVNIAPPKFQNITVLVVLTSINFSFVLLTDIIVAIYASVELLLLVCQLIFSVWGMVITVGYFVVAYRTRRNLKATFEAPEQQARYESTDQREFKKLRRLVIKCYLSSLLGLVTFGLSLYAITLGGSSVLSDAKFVNSWTWWAFQTTFRVLELLMNLLIIVIALGTSRGR